MKRIISGAILLLCFIGFGISAWAAGIVNPSFVFSKNGLAKLHPVRLNIRSA